MSASLIARCIQRDHAAWAELIGTHRSAVLRVLVRTVGTAGMSATDDLEQEVWSRLLANGCEALRGLQQAEATAVRSFVCRTAMNVALDHRRRLAVRQGASAAALDELVDPEEPVEVAYARHERRAEIFAALEEVIGPPNGDRDRMIFRAHYVDGFTAAEIARMGVGLQPKGVETLLLRLVGRVRAVLQMKNEDAA